MVTVIKANGKKEPFSEEKVITSIRRARIASSLQPDVLAHVKTKLYDGITTNEIYYHISEFLGRSPNPYGKSSYSLKGAIMMLGPTGYPFEDFVATVLQEKQYQTKVRQILSGKCVTHEIDIIAEKEGKSIMIEAKFHNSPGARSEIHVALYTQARFEDVKEKNSLHETWLVTNTKTTSDANAYAQCVGMKIMSWSYPEGESLRDLIEKDHLYPITLLGSLPQIHKANLLQQHIVLCKQLRDNPKILETLPLSKEEKEKVIAEIAFIYSNTT